MPTVQPTLIDRIGYRGISLETVDYRYIFERGFAQKRDSFTNEPYDMYYNSHVDDEDNFDIGGDGPRSGDMASISANCVSTQIAVAALFPADVTKEWTWIFAVYVLNGFNTYEQQQMDAWEIISRRPELHESYLLGRITWPIQAEEFAAVSIPGRHVLGCVRCQRQWNSGSWKTGGRYTLDDTLYWNTANIDPVLPAARVTAIKNYMKDQIRRNPTGDLPMTNE